MDHSQVCRRCTRIVPPRGQALPRFCPTCGAALPVAELAAAPHPPTVRPRVPVAALLALGLGLASLLLLRSGIPIGIFAIAFGVSARGQINAANGRLTGGGIALAALILGIVSTVIWLRAIL